MSAVMEEEQIKPWMAGASWRSWWSFLKARLGWPRHAAVRSDAGADRGGIGIGPRRARAVLGILMCPLTLRLLHTVRAHPTVTRDVLLATLTSALQAALWRATRLMRYGSPASQSSSLPSLMSANSGVEK